MGGMAQIYLARQQGPEGFEKLLVLKRILPHLTENAEFVRMFLDEARIAARLNHPNVVQIFNLGAEGDTYFIAMEYIHGADVRRVWKQSEAVGQPLPVPLACRILIEACAGLDYAHKKADAAGRPLGIVHRDVSPQNILVTFEGGVKVVDFGIAKAADQATVTRSGVLKGKYSYMSPEQAAGMRVDCRSDVFALGVVLYELLTGARLFKRPSDLQTLAAVAECQVAVPSQVAPRVPQSLDAIVLKALAKEPEARFQEALHLQLALEDWLSQNRLPSSTAHLGAFMKEAFAERLAEESRAGEFLVEDSESAPSSARADSASPARRTGLKPALPPNTGRSESEPTATLRPRTAHANRPSRPELRRDEPEAEPPRAPTGTRRAVESVTPARASRMVPAQRPEGEGLPGAEARPSRSGMPPVVEEDAPTLAMMEPRGLSFPPTARPDLAEDEDAPTLDQRAASRSATVSLRQPIRSVEEDAPTMDARAVARPSPTATRGMPAADVGPVGEPRAASRSGVSIARATPGPEARVSRAGVPVAEPSPAVAVRGPSRMSVPAMRSVPPRTDTLTEHATLSVTEGEARSNRVGLWGGIGAAVVLAVLALWLLLRPDAEPAGTVPLNPPALRPPPPPARAQPPPEQGAATQVVPATNAPAETAPGTTPSTQPTPAPTVAAAPADQTAPAHVAAPQAAPREATPPRPVAPARTEPKPAEPRAAPVREVVRAEPKVADRMALVRFVATPWAEVSCNGRKLGETPFKEVELRVGTYDCKFSNPELKRTVSRRIEVRPIDLNVVSVKLD
ncbi:serine/threonine protein kinase [Corallococcus sp. H22C18031201]|nr:serine/threonine protein kinase [Corallococcus sp. H22C18031201]